MVKPTHRLPDSGVPVHISQVRKYLQNRVATTEMVKDRKGEYVTRPRASKTLLEKLLARSEGGDSAP
jgi:hypothetical protein